MDGLTRAGSPVWLSPERPEWSAYLAASPHDFYHLPAYVALEASRLGGEAGAFVYHGDDDRFLLPLVIRPVAGSDARDAVSPYGYPGPLATTRDPGFLGRAARALVSDLRRRGIVSAFVRMHPLLDRGLAAASAPGTFVHHGDTVAIDLRRDEAELWGAVRSNHRNQINRARRRGDVVRIIDCDGSLEAFEEIYDAEMRRLDSAPEYRFGIVYLRDLAARLGARVRLALVLVEGEVACAGMFVACDGVVEYHLGATRHVYRKIHPSKLMFDAVRRWAKERGERFLHLGGGLGGRPDSVFHFKAGFSDTTHPFRTWRIIADEARYRELCDDTDDPTGFFPAYRRGREVR